MHPRLRNLLLATTPLLALGLTQASAGPEGGVGGRRRRHHLRARAARR